jgi:hypothetical protein
MLTLDRDVATALRALSPGNKTLGRTASLLIREALVRREERLWLRQVVLDEWADEGPK